MLLMAGITSLVAAVLAAYNALNNHMNLVWVIVTILFAANGIRWIVKYIKDKKQY